MEGIAFLNLEYLILKIYHIFDGSNVSLLPQAILSVVGIIEFFSILISLAFLYGIVYSQMRTSQINRELEQRREAKRSELLGKSTIKNERWVHILELTASLNPNDWRQAVIEADVLLDRMLDDLQIPGESVGEKLKSVSRDHFTTLDMAWDAHKVRNEIAHEGSAFELTARETKRAIDLFRQVFEEFDYI